MSLENKRIWRSVEDFLDHFRLTPSDLVRFYHEGLKLPVGYGADKTKPLILGGDTDYDVSALLQLYGIGPRAGGWS